MKGQWTLSLLMAAASLVATARADASSLRLVENRPAEYDFLDIAQLPPDFGRGEFAVELWIKPDASYPVGPIWRAGYNQLRNWSEADPEPYSSDGWWLTGNWLLDGHTRPRGFGPGDSREGTLSLQFYGGGRLRFMFADTDVNMPRGMVHAVQAWPASTTPSLLDGRWHHVVVVRRWREPSGARLELWIDGAMVASRDIPLRTDMRRFWSRPSHPEDPPELGGWSLGAEVMTAWNYAFTQYEDYKGLVDALRFWGRAPTAQEIGALAQGTPPRDRRGLLAQFDFDEGSGTTVRDVRAGLTFTLHRGSAASWSPENAPARR